MRIPVVAGNWKMNKTVDEARKLVYEISMGINDIKGVDKVIIPPYLSILPAAALLVGTDIGLGAQDMHWEEKGAFTGEISAGMIAEYCKYILIGHSERRTYFNETDVTVNKKLFTAITHNLIPIVCVGETLAERESGQTEDVVRRQIKVGLAGLTEQNSKNLIIAYEPVWAIGTGKASTGEDASNVIKNMIRAQLAEQIGNETASRTRVLYGGSVTGANAAEFFQFEEIGGALVGGASLKTEEIIKITQAAIASN